MARSTSRRDVLKAGAACATAIVVPAAAAADSIPSTADVEGELGHRMPEEARKLLKASLEANRKNATDRLKHRLPDCSEPCFTYIPTGARR
jgi:hypothetical protein